MGESSDRRRYRRFDVHGLPGSLAFSTDAKVVNLSLAGAAIETPTPLAPGQKFAVKIGQPPEVMQLQGSVCWCRPVEQRPRGATPSYRSGLSFNDILTDRARELMGFMERNIVLALDHQLFGRLDLEGEATANLETDYRIVVKRLGLGGVLGEVRHPVVKDGVYELELNLEGRQFISRGRTVSVKVSPDKSGLYEVAIEFVDTEPEHREHLVDYLQTVLESDTAI